MVIIPYFCNILFITIQQNAVNIISQKIYRIVTIKSWTHIQSNDITKIFGELELIKWYFELNKTQTVVFQTLQLAQIFAAVRSSFRCTFLLQCNLFWTGSQLPKPSVMCRGSMRTKDPRAAVGMLFIASVILLRKNIISDLMKPILVQCVLEFCSTTISDSIKRILSCL